MTEPAFGEVVASRAGVVDIPGGSGVVALLIPVPAGRARVEVEGSPSVRALSAGLLVAEEARPVGPWRRRFRFEVEAPPAGGAVELQLADPAFTEPVRVLVRPAGGDAQGPERPAKAAAGGLAGRAHWGWVLPAGSSPSLATRALATRQRGDALRVQAQDSTSGAPNAGARAEGGASLARASRARLPTSCVAAEAWLDTGWERLKIAPAPLSALPGCPELRLRAAALALEAWRLELAEALLGELARSAAGQELRARIALTRGRVALARGDLSSASALAAEARTRGELEAGLELGLRAARLAGDDGAEGALVAVAREADGVSDLTRRRAVSLGSDLGLPLVDGLALAQQAAARDGDGDGDGDGDSYEVLLDDLHTTVFRDGAMVHRVHRVVRLLTHGAVEEFGEIGLPEAAEILRARTLKPVDGGGFQPIEPEDLLEKTTISLPALEAGAVAEVAWMWWSAPAPRLGAAWEAPRFTFESDRGPTRRARYTIGTPPGVAVEVLADPGAPRPQEVAPGVLRFELTDRPRILPEPLDPRPDRRRVGVRVRRAPEVAALIAGMGDEARRAAIATPAVRAAVEEALAELPPHAGAEARLRALHRFVLDEIKGVDVDPLAASASFAAAARTGERSLLLTSMCRVAGLDCALVLARPHTYGAVDPRRLELDSYLYPAVRARLGQREVWLDLASRFAPFDYLPPLVQGAAAIDLGAGARLVTPRTPDREGERRVSWAVTIAPGGDAYEARGEETLTGVYAMSWREALIAMTPDGRRQVLAQSVQRSLPGARVEDVVIEALDAVAVPLRVRWRAAGALQPGAGDRRGLTLGLAPEQLGRATVLLAERTTPLLVNRASRLVMEVEIGLPAGLSLRRLPAEVEAHHQLVTLSQRAVLTERGRRLRLSKTFRLSAGIVPPEGYSEWTRVARAVDAAEVVHLVFEPAMTRATESTR